MQYFFQRYEQKSPHWSVWESACSALLLASLIAMLLEAPVTEGMSRSSALFLLGWIISLFSVIFYSIDAVLSILKVVKGEYPTFHAVLAVLLLGSIPMAFLVRGSLVWLWNAYHLTVFVLELISIKKVYNA